MFTPIHGTDGETASTSALTVAHPQLSKRWSWDSFVLPGGALRPYASLEAWDAPAADRNAYPAR